MIISGASSQSLAGRLASTMDDRLGVTDIRHFPDDEFVVEIPDPRDRVIVVASTPTPEAHIELLQLQDAAREGGSQEVVTVIPYMGYARQDEAFRSGQPVSARAVARAISTGTDRVVVVNPHERSIQDWFTVPTTVVDAAPRLAGALPEELEDPLFLAPDGAAIGLAESVRDGYGRGDCDHFEKRRDRVSGSIALSSEGLAVEDRDLVVVDDMVATGGTVSEAVSKIEGAHRVFVCCVHALLVGSARSALTASGVEAVFATDTLERPESVVSAAPTLAEVL